MKTGLRKQTLVIVAHLSVVLAVIGIFLPLLPTTPFLLLAAAIYLKHSKRMYSWLMNHEVLGRMVYDYMIHRSIHMKQKILAWLSLWTGIGISLHLSSNVWIRVVLGVVALLVSLHIYKLKTRLIDPKGENSHQEQRSNMNLSIKLDSNSKSK